MLSCLNLGELRMKYVKFNDPGHIKHIQAFSGLWTPDLWMLPLYKKPAYILLKRMTPAGQEYFQSFLQARWPGAAMAGRHSFTWNPKRGPETHSLINIMFYVKHRLPASPQKPSWPKILFKFYTFAGILFSTTCCNNQITYKSCELYFCATISP